MIGRTNAVSNANGNLAEEYTINWRVMTSNGYNSFMEINVKNYNTLKIIITESASNYGVRIRTLSGNVLGSKISTGELVVNVSDYDIVTFDSLTPTVDSTSKGTMQFLLS